MREVTPAITFEQQPVPRPITAVDVRLMWLAALPDDATDALVFALLDVIAERDGWRETALADLAGRHDEQRENARLRQRNVELIEELRQARQSTRPPS